tara:strand:- start:138 stop:701 length:564 start_codon:yes stop_codon:yes gene_type:complete
MDKRLIILDRDGVINHDSPEYIKNPTEWLPIDGSPQAISKLNNAGYLVVIATNQAGLSRGIFSFEDLHSIHSKMLNTLSQYGGTIDAIFFCPHSPNDQCKCRKPEPGMLIEIKNRFRVDLKNVRFIGDSKRDLLAAEKSGAIPCLVKTGNGLKTINENAKNLKKIPKNTKIFENLEDAVEKILLNAG